MDPHGHEVYGNLIIFWDVDVDEFAPDNDPTNWDSTGKMLSLGRNHANYDPSGVADAIKNNPDAVTLSYFEHGNCIWQVAGEPKPLGTEVDWHWDGVNLAGAWVPDENLLAEATNLTRR